MALPLVADFGGGDAAGAGADIGRAVFLARVVEVAGLGSCQAVVLSGHRWLACKHEKEKTMIINTQMVQLFQIFEHLKFDIF